MASTTAPCAHPPLSATTAATAAPHPAPPGLCRVFPFYPLGGPPAALQTSRAVQHFRSPHGLLKCWTQYSLRPGSSFPETGCPPTEPPRAPPNSMDKIVHAA